MLKRSVCLPAHMWQGLKRWRQESGQPASYVFRSLVDKFLRENLDGYASSRARRLDGEGVKNYLDEYRKRPNEVAESSHTESGVSSDR